MKETLSKYFNKTTFGGNGPATSAVVATAVGAFLLSTGAPIGIALGVAHFAIAAGYTNMWQEAATGSPIWKPKTPLFGL